MGALLDEVVAEALRGGGGWVMEVATLDVRADEAGIVAAVRDRGWRLVGVPAAELGQVTVPNQSRKVKETVGVGSVAEAAALVRARAHGLENELGSALVVPKRRSERVTAAVARVKIECPSRSWLERDYAGQVRRRVRRPGRSGRSGEELRP